MDKMTPRFKNPITDPSERERVAGCAAAWYDEQATPLLLQLAKARGLTDDDITTLARLISAAYLNAWMQAKAECDG